MSDSGSGYPPQWQPPNPSGPPGPTYQQPGYGPPTQPTYPPGSYQPPSYPPPGSPPYGAGQYPPPAYPTAGYGAPPPPAPTGGGGRNWLLISVGAVVVAAVVAVVLVLTLGSGDSSNPIARSGATASALPSGLPTDLPTDLPTSLPSGLLSELPTSVASLCDQTENGLLVAAAYVGLAESGDTDGAQGCVYQTTVPRATTQKLSGQTLLPTGLGSDDGTLTLQSTSGSTVTIKTTKEPDGKYYVTSVSIG